MHWLKEEGFRVYTTKDFQNDLQNNNLSLEREVVLHNLFELKNISEKYSEENFRKTLYAECTTNTKE